MRKRPILGWVAAIIASTVALAGCDEASQATPSPAAELAALDFGPAPSRAVIGRYSILLRRDDHLCADADLRKLANMVAFVAEKTHSSALEGLKAIEKTGSTGLDLACDEVLAAYQILVENEGASKSSSVHAQTSEPPITAAATRRRKEEEAKEAGAAALRRDGEAERRKLANRPTPPIPNQFARGARKRAAVTEVPNVLEEERAPAVEAVKDAGFTPVVVPLAVTEASEAGRVVRQQRIAQEGKTVTLYVGHLDHPAESANQNLTTNTVTNSPAAGDSYTESSATTP